LPKLIFNEALKQMLNDLVGDVIAETRRRLQAQQIATLEDVRSAKARLVGFSPRMEALRRQAKQYLYDALYRSDELVRDQREAALMVQQLFEAWVREPALLPAGHEARIDGEGAARVVADYLAGMTDQFVLAQYRNWQAQTL
jgi:dGTPase